MRHQKNIVSISLSHIISLHPNRNPFLFISCFFPSFIPSSSFSLSPLSPPLSSPLLPLPSFPSFLPSLPLSAIWLLLFYFFSLKWYNLFPNTYLQVNQGTNHTFSFLFFSFLSCAVFTLSGGLMFTYCSFTLILTFVLVLDLQLNTFNAHY